MHFCFDMTKMYGLYRKMTIYGHFFYIIYTFLFGYNTKMYRLCRKMIIDGHISRFSVHFWNPSLDCLMPEIITNESSYKALPVYFWFDKSTLSIVQLGSIHFHLGM